jgi:hypothetical protein
LTNANFFMKRTTCKNAIKYIAAILVILRVVSMQNALANKLVGHRFAVSDLRFFEKEEDFRKGEFNGTAFEKGRGIVFQKTGDSPDSGSYMSPLVKAPFPMTELLPSWNVDVPATTGFSISIQITTDTLNFSPWLFLGREGEAPEPDPKNLSWNKAVVDVDYIKSPETFTHYRWKIDFFAPDAKKAPALRLFSVCHGNSEGNEALFKRFAKKVSAPENFVKKLEVPYRSQLANDPEIPEKRRLSICCPVSLSMVLEYHDISIPVSNLCDLCRDLDTGILGNWPRAAQILHRFGLRSYVAQIRSFEEIIPYIDRGIPLVGSIRVSEGDLPSAPYEHVPGHIVVIVGVQGYDAVWVNDPYNPDGKKGPILWTRRELETVLIGRGGVVIVSE